MKQAALSATRIILLVNSYRGKWNSTSTTEDEGLKDALREWVGVGSVAVLAPGSTG